MSSSRRPASIIVAVHHQVSFPEKLTRSVPLGGPICLTRKSCENLAGQATCFFAYNRLVKPVSGGGSPVPRFSVSESQILCYWGLAVNRIAPENDPLSPEDRRDTINEMRQIDLSR